jgi:phosphoribosylaminoimidazolecarboxamide formyltransferase / IMP cyclohydrolase
MVNLYPFEKTVARPEASIEEARGNIDIGGPCMIRAAAKNFLRVAAVVDPADYPEVLRELRENAGCLTLRMRFALARKAFSHTAAYDGAISAYFASRSFEEAEACYRTEEAQ